MDHRELPRAVVETDKRLASLLARHRLAEHLNPLNPAEARHAWRAGAPAPPFAYAAALWADEALADLDTLRPPEDHPFGARLRGSIEEFRAFILALRDRTAEAFHSLASVHGWYPDPPSLAPKEPRTRTHSPNAPVSASEMYGVLREALDARGFVGWSVSFDPVMSSRVLVDAPRRELRVNPRAVFRSVDRKSLVAHEIDVHVQRSVNGEDQPLQVFRTGLPGALATEEGLAILAEERAGVPMGQARERHAVVARAVLFAQTAGFREVYDSLAADLGAEAAWTITLRVKRGLALPGEPGCFAKDAVYHTGHGAVRAWLDNGGDLADLYVGKVGLGDPIGAWRTAGLVGPRPVPALWLNPPGSDSA